MEAVLRLWFNGAREYYTGVALLRRAAPGNGAIRLLSTGPSSYNTPRLLQELQQVLDELQGNAKPAAKPTNITVRKATPVITAPAEDLPAVNQPLYDSCIADARKAYKEAMNLRAELFALARPDVFNDVNLPDTVRKRSPLAIDVVRKYNEASRLFDVADHARTTGRLVTDLQEEDAVEEYTDLPDIMVKPTLDNLRKNYNKMKKRPVTPERTVLIQKHEKSIERLKLRWDKINGIQ